MGSATKTSSLLPLSRLEEIPIPKEQNRPHARSGHRSVADASAVYVFGGYHGDGQLLFPDVWRFDVIREEWKLIGSSDNYPTSVASSSVLLCGNSLLVFGGSGVPFGYANSNQLHLINLRTGQSKELPCTGDIPEKKYGASMAPSQDGRLYLYGGTTGSFFNSDVHCLDLKTQVYTKLESAGKNKPEPRYRHEMVWDSKKFYVIGGSTIDQEYRFDTIHAFDFESQLWNECACHPAQRDGFPNSRRFHACAKLNHMVYLSGGTSWLDVMYDDVWSLHLVTLQWTRLAVKLPVALFFHSMAVTPAGCLYIFGGCTTLAGTNRSDKMYKMWLRVPSLMEMCWLKLTKSYPRLLDVGNSKLHALGIPLKLVNRLNQNTEAS
ncbi:kelch domain-containing protein 10-like [Oscarella lobularis]|uniref:kelch domain-containing protein 10-like n=1 Tax=Oscarella lobularis TaxID=121494 RepID=UPI003313E92B